MKAKFLWAVVVLGIVGVVAWRVSAVRDARAVTAEKPAEVALIKTGRVVRADLVEKVTFTGTIRPRNEVDVFPKAGGRIEALNVQVGDQVKVAVVEHREVSWQAKAGAASVSVAKAGLAGAQLEYGRTLQLFEGGSATKAMVDGAKVKLDLAQAQCAQAEAASGLALQQLFNATIVAPIAGTITRRPVNLATQVGPGAPIASILDIASLKLEASVDAPSFARLAKGAEAQVVVDALPDEVFAGKVTLLSPTLDSVSRRAAIELEVDNTQGKLLPNMFARAEVRVGLLKGALAVPKIAIVEGAGGSMLYRIKAGKAELLHPKLGPTDRELTAVVTELAEGDEVAVNGQAALSDGAPVKTQALSSPVTELIKKTD
jgi:membrane fusion protein (multidrug efflux system)